MFIKEIELKNFKCFEESKFTFEKNFTAIIGDNGSGKTALLDGIASTLKSFLPKVTSGIQPNEIRVHNPKIGNKQRIEYKFPVEVKSQLNFDFLSEPIFSLVSLGNNLSEENQYIEAPKNKIKGTFPVNVMISKNISNDKFIIPFIGYYRTNRLWNLEKKGDKVDLYPIAERLKPYEDCLNPTVNDKILLEWFKRMTYIEIQKKKKIEELEAVKQSLQMALYNLEKIEVSIYFDVQSDTLVIKKEETGLPFHLLSDGYRNTLGMIADIAYRMAELNPHLTTKSPGIVLIDELDLHLHPKWQRHIVNDLKTIFPNCQFIITTHSPFIIQSLESGELLKLDETPEIEHDHFNKKGIEDIAEEFQDVEMPQRSIKFQEMLKVAEEYYDLIEQGETNGKLVPLRKRLTELEEIYSEEPAFVALLKAERKSKNI